MIKKQPYIGMPINLSELDIDEPKVMKAPLMNESHPAETKDNPHKNLSLAMAYVIWQEWEKTYNYEKALSRGTIFEELDLPFMAYRGGIER